MATSSLVEAVNERKKDHIRAIGLEVHDYSRRKKDAKFVYAYDPAWNV